MEGDREVIDVGKWPEEIDLYSEIPMHAQLRAIIEGHRGVSISQTLSKQYGVMLGSRDLRVRSVCADTSRSKQTAHPRKRAGRRRARLGGGVDPQPAQQETKRRETSRFG